MRCWSGLGPVENQEVGDLCRQLPIRTASISDARARCVSSARRDLCGGRSVMSVPTATIRPGIELQALEPELLGPRVLFDHLVGEGASLADRVGDVLRFNRTKR